MHKHYKIWIYLIKMALNIRHMKKTYCQIESYQTRSETIGKSLGAKTTF